MDVAKQANQIVKEVLEKLTDKKDIANFSQVPEIFNNASGMVNGDERNEALLAAWMASQATNAVFLLWRRGIEHADVEKKLRALPTTDELAAKYEAFLQADKKISDDLEAKRRAFMKNQHKLDIFKAILNGMTKEQAEEGLKKYQDSLEKSMKG